MQIPGYRIERELGRGGMATVYLAVQTSLKRRVALKVMKPSLARDAAFTARFLKEGPTVANLTHPNIVKVFDTGVHLDHYYLSMEYLAGGNLKQRIHGLAIEEAIEIIKAITDALAHAHQNDIVHRDLKPQNILFYASGTPVLSDFGIAKAVSSSTSLTETGTYIGSASYMSPEQIQGKRSDARSDLYALGILFYEMLMGEPPYGGDDQFAIAYGHVNGPIPELPPVLLEFQPILNTLLAKQPEQRFASAEAVLAALRQAERRYLVGGGAISAGGQPGMMPQPLTPQHALSGQRDFSSGATSPASPIMESGTHPAASYPGTGAGRPHPVAPERATGSFATGGHYATGAGAPSRPGAAMDYSAPAGVPRELQGHPTISATKTHIHRPKPKGKRWLTITLAMSSAVMLGLLIAILLASR